MEIKLDSPSDGRSPVYSLGDIVAGTFTYNARGERKCLQRLTLALEVHGYITADPLSHDGASIDLYHQLFCKEVCLWDDAFIVKQPLVWPFRFALPTTCEDNGRKWLPPPSFSHVFQGTHRQAAFCVMVQYRLRATASEDSAQQPIEFCKSLTVQQTSNTALHRRKETLSQIPMTQTSIRNTICRQVKERLQILFHVVGRPHASNFHATLSLPKELYRGKTGAVRLIVQKGMSGPSMQEPSLVLQSIRLRLQGTLHTIGERQVTREYGTFDSHPNLRLSLQEKPTTITSDISIDSFVRGALFTPDFYSPSPYVRHSHFIDVEMDIIEEETGNVFQLLGRGSVNVLPPASGVMAASC
jgi:hypothetical protein